MIGGRKLDTEKAVPANSSPGGREGSRLQKNALGVTEGGIAVPFGRGMSANAASGSILPPAKNGRLRPAVVPPPSHHKTPVIPPYPAISQVLGRGEFWNVPDRTVMAKTKNEKTNPSFPNPFISSIFQW